MIQKDNICISESKELQKKGFLAFKDFKYLCLEFCVYQPSKTIKDSILNRHIQKAEKAKQLKKLSSYIAINTSSLKEKIVLPSCPNSPDLNSKLPTLSICKNISSIQHKIKVLHFQLGEKNK